jgi:class 3 adenylate cyclase
MLDTLAGAVLDSLAQAEHHAGKGEVLIDSGIAGALGDLAEIGEWRELEEGQVFGVARGLLENVEPAPWPDLPPKAISAAQARPWLLPAVYERLLSGQGEFLAELRPAVSFSCVSPGSITGDHPPVAGCHVRQVQRVVTDYEAVLIQLTIGDKGSYLQAAFGAPVAHEDDAARALSAAMELQTPRLAFIDQVQIGISKGRMRSGAYGSVTRRTYGMMGDDVNLAARLMQAARPGQILVNQSVCRGIESHYLWEELPALRVKGKAELVEVYGLLGRKEKSASQMLEAKYALPMVGRQAELVDIKQRMEISLQIQASWSVSRARQGGQNSPGLSGDSDRQTKKRDRLSGRVPILWDQHQLPGVAEHLARFSDSIQPIPGGTGQSFGRATGCNRSGPGRPPAASRGGAEPALSRITN